MNARTTLPTLILLAGLALAYPLRAQQGPPPPPGQAQGGAPPRGPERRGPGEGGRGGRGGNPAAVLRMPPGRWWDDAHTAQALGLSAEQTKKMDEVFQGVRDHLIDLDADVRKADAGLQPLLENDPIDRAAAMAQIERLTEAQARLETANAEMLLDIRLQLTHEQWTKLAALRPPPPPER